jgi:hypothetical protein
MNNKDDFSKLLILLNKAVAREMQVSIQYMLQHSVLNARATNETTNKSHDKQDKFV